MIFLQGQQTIWLPSPGADLVLTADKGNKLPDDNDKPNINGKVINMFERTQALRLAA